MVDQPPRDAEDPRGPASIRRLVTPYRLAVSLLLSIAVVALGAGFILSKEQTPERCGRGVFERVYPCESDLDVRQTRIGVDLVAGYTAVLFLDGVELPEDQLERRPETGEVLYIAAPGTETGALSPGRHCAGAEYWRTTEDRGRSQLFEWCFTVH